MRGWSDYLTIPDSLSISRKEVENILLFYPPCKTLDLGSGYGRISIFLKSRNFGVLSVDNDRKMIEVSKRNNIDAFLMDAFHLGFPDNSFELVITDGLLEHFTNPVPIIKEERRVSSRYIINFVPKDSLINIVLERIQKVPKEYRREMDEWIEIHGKIFSNVTVKSLRRLFAIQCEK